MAQWSQAMQLEKNKKKDDARQKQLVVTLKPVIERRVKVMQLLRKNGWLVQAILPLPVEWHSCDVVPCEGTALLKEVDFKIKPPGAHEVICRGIEALARKAGGMK